MKSIQEKYQINDLEFKLYLNVKQIDEIVSRLAKQITVDYTGKNPIFLMILNGSFIFAADLLRKINMDLEVETAVAKSYGDEMFSSGTVNISNINLELKGRNVIIIEDIVDSGLTLQSLLNKLKKQEPESIETVCLLSKPSQRAVEVRVKYVGIEIEPDFVVGYGLDFAGKGRNLPAIYIKNDSVD